MNACGGEAARVLREYAYFSPELKAILEKAALMQADRRRTGGMFHAPKSSPWGEVQSCETLCPGVFLVSTASHGGTMVANEVAAVLSPAAKKCGFKDKGYICYEEEHRKVWCSGSCWTKNCGTSLTALRTKNSLKKNSISPSGSITRILAGKAERTRSRRSCPQHSPAKEATR